MLNRGFPPRKLRSKSAVLLCLVLFVAAGCADRTAPDATTSSAAPLADVDRNLLASARVALPPVGVDPATLPDPNSAGALELQRFCVACHALPSPAMHSPSDWPAVLRRMWLRMGLIDPALGVPVPEIGDRLVLLRYLMDNGLQVTAMTLPDLPGRATFEESCAKCHALPDPRQHSPLDWYVVVERMSEHSRGILQQEFTADQIREIVAFLEKVSA